MLPLRTLYNFLPTAIIAYAFLDYNMQNQWSIPIFWDGSCRIGLFFQSVCSLTTFTPYDKTETAQRLKVPPPYPYHTKILGYISSNAHKPDRPHNQRTIHDQQHISEKSVLHSFQTDNHRKRHSHSLPRYNPDCTTSAQITQTRQPYISQQTRTIYRYHVRVDHSTSPRVQHSQSIHP